MNVPINVLFIEDNPGDARLVREELLTAGSKTLVHLEWVDRLDKGLERLASNHFEAVLLDLSLPDSEGLETVQRVLSRAPQLPVIVMTGQTDEEVGMKAMQAGAQDYLIKGQVNGSLLGRVIQYAVQRKQTEMQLADALEFTERVLTSAPMGILTYRLTGECLSANAYAAQMIGTTIAGLKSQNFRELESWKKSGLYRLAEEAIASRKLTTSDVHVLTTFGKEAWFQAQFVTFKSAGEELLLLIVGDITKRKQIEEALRESEENYRQLFEAESDAIFLIENETGQILQANQTACVLYGYSREELLARKNTDLSAEPEQTSRVTKETPIAPDQLINIPLRFHRRKDGTVFPVEITGRFFLHQGRPVHIAAMRDITERRRAEEALRASEERFRRYFELGLIGMAITSPDKSFIEVNDRICEILGYARTELMQMTWDTLTYADDLAADLEHFTRLLTGELNGYSMEKRFIHKSGSMVYTSISVNSVRRADGSLDYLVALMEDITERKQAEAALEASEKRFRTWIENSSDVITVVDLKGRILYESPSITHLLGYAQEELLGKNAFEFIHPEDQDKIIDLFVGSIQGPDAVTSAEFRFRHREGTWKFLEAIGRTYTDEHGEVVALINSRDVSERKQAEAAVAAMQKRFQALIENAPDGIALLGLDGRLRQVTPSTQQILGYSSQEAEGQDPASLTHPADLPALLSLLGDLIQNPGKVAAMQYRFRHKDGSWRWLESTISNLSDEPGVQAIVFNYRDITKSRQAEEALREQQRLLSEAQQIGHIGSWSYDILTDTIRFSDEMYRLLDVLPEEFQHDSQNFLCLIYPADRPVAAQWMEQLKTGRQAAELDFRVFRKNGELRYIQSRGAVEFDSTGRPVQFIGMAQDITEHRLADIQIQQQMQRLQALRKIDQALTTSFNLHLTLHTVLTETITQLQVDAAVILLLDSAGQTLEYAAGQGMRTRLSESARVPLSGSHAGQVARERRLIRIENLKNQPDDPLLTTVLAGEDFVCYYGVPLISKGKVVGVLEIFHRVPLQPYPEWLDFLKTLAGQAAIAVENTVLFENLQTTNRELFRAYDATIEGWSRAMDLRDRETEGHTQRVTAMTISLARQFGFGEEELLHIRRGALLHDIGKMGVPDNILNKSAALTEAEWASMRRHPQFAHDMLHAIEYLRPALDIPYCHHEKWDGSGYPRGLKGEEIPMAARLFAVVDVWDALTSDRPYRPAWPQPEALDYLRQQSGRHFDPQVVELFFKVIK